MPSQIIKIADFLKKNIDPQIREVYGPEDLDEQGNLLSFNEQVALITHYAMLRDDYENNKSYERARDVLNGWYQWIGQNRDTARKFDADIVADDADAFQTYLFNDLFEVPFPSPEHPRFTFIDLFAGIGGFRLAMQANGGKCVYSSEWNEYAQKTYFANFGEMPFGDITKDSIKRFIPRNFDVLCAGFPCQPFSIAGVSKKRSLGRETGFKDKTQGTLFFEVADILGRYRPRAFYLENVKNLLSHDKGKTFKVIKETLEELDYSIHFKVMDGNGYVPQHRERIMIVGFDNRRYHGNECFEFPDDPERDRTIGEILLEEVPSKYTLTDHLWKYLQDYAIKQKAKGNGFGFGLVNLNGIARTLSARYYKDGSEILIPQGDGTNPRRLTPRECARLMGYPDNYRLDQVSDVQAYRQCGNSVVVPLITAVSHNVIEAMEGNNHE